MGTASSNPDMDRSWTIAPLSRRLDGALDSIVSMSVSLFHSVAST